MAQAFKDSGQTNFYFAFWVYDDSFEAFMRAREAAARLGFQYGWEPLPQTSVATGRARRTRSAAKLTGVK
jgi:hypothetical protein